MKYKIKLKKFNNPLTILIRRARTGEKTCWRGIRELQVVYTHSGNRRRVVRGYTTRCNRAGETWGMLVTVLWMKLPLLLYCSYVHAHCEKLGLTDSCNYGNGISRAVLLSRSLLEALRINLALIDPPDDKWPRFQSPSPSSLFSYSASHHQPISAKFFRLYEARNYYRAVELRAIHLRGRWEDILVIAARSFMQSLSRRSCDITTARI